MCGQYATTQSVGCLCWFCHSKIDDSGFAPELTEDERMRLIQEFPVITGMEFKDDRFITQEENLGMINAAFEMVGNEFGIPVNWRCPHSSWS